MDEWTTTPLFYHSEKLQSTKTAVTTSLTPFQFYHSEKLQSTKTRIWHTFMPT